jgi:hypothetical protein
LRVAPLGKVLAVAKCVVNAGTGAVVATRETSRGLIVPVAVEREIPADLAPKFDVVGNVEIGMHATRVGEHRSARFFTAMTVSGSCLADSIRFCHALSAIAWSFTRNSLFERISILMLSKGV